MNDVIAQIEDLERRIRTNGGHPVIADKKLVQLLSFARTGHISGGTTTIGHRHLVTIGKAKRRLQAAISEQVAFKLNPAKWTTREYKEMELERMETSHIRNSLIMIRDGRMKRDMCNGLTIQQWARVFENELLLRAMR